MNKHK
jgi:hypothetical protein